MLRKLCFFSLFLMFNSCAMENQGQKMNKKDEKDFERIRQETYNFHHANFKEPFFDKVTIDQSQGNVGAIYQLNKRSDSSDQPYLEQMVDSVKVGPIKAIGQFSFDRASLLINELLGYAFPDPGKVLNDSLESTQFTQKSIEWSHHLLDTCNKAIIVCPDSLEKKIYQGYYDEMENVLLSSNYYKQQKKNDTLEKLGKLNKIMEINIPNIAIAGQKFLKSTTKKDKERYGHLYHDNLSNTLKELHAIVYEDDSNKNKKGMALVGLGVGLGGSIVGGFAINFIKNFKLI